jgi:hypothetical protein
MRWYSSLKLFLHCAYGISQHDLLLNPLCLYAFRSVCRRTMSPPSVVDIQPLAEISR